MTTRVAKPWPTNGAWANSAKLGPRSAIRPLPEPISADCSWTMWLGWRIDLNVPSVPGITIWMTTRSGTTIGARRTASARLSQRNTKPSTMSISAAVREPEASAPSVRIALQPSQKVRPSRLKR